AGLQPEPAVLRPGVGWPILLQCAQDLARRGEAPRFMFGVDQAAVHLHIEYAARTGDERRLHTRRATDFRCQTGSPGPVVSDAAIGDGDVHATLRALATRTAWATGTS